MNRFWIPFVTLTTMSFGSTLCRADSNDELLARIPEQANILAFIDNTGLENSPLGVKLKWAENYQKSAVGGLFGGPPHLTRLVLATQIDHHTLQNQWEIGVAELGHGYSITNKALVASTGGTRDSVGGHEVTLTPQNTYLALFDHRHVGVMCPANRQALGRWLRMPGFTGTARISQFLQNSVSNMPKGSQALLAIDMADMFDADGLRQRLKKSKIIADGNIGIDDATNLFAEIKGLTLALRVSDDINGELRVVFNTAPTFLMPVAKKLLMSAFAKIGATIDDFENWDTLVDGNAILLSGKLTQSSVRKLFSPLTLPTFVTSDGGHADDTPAAASVRYFGAVRSYIDDLRDTKSRTSTDRSFWFNQFANKIDKLPTLNVDPDLLKYGAEVSSTFRGLANLGTNTLQQQRLAAANSNNPFYYYNGAGWGYDNFPSRADSLIAANNLICQQGNTEIAIRNETWKNIEAATVAVRDQMTQKYQTQFK